MTIAFCALVAFTCSSQNIEQIDIAFGKGELKTAAKQYESLAKKSKNKLDLYVQALYGNALAKINLHQENMVFEILKEAEIHARENPSISKTTRARMKITLGKYHLAYKEYDLALPLLNEGKKLSKTLGASLAPSMHIELNQSLGELYYNRKNYKKALDYYDQAIKVADTQAHEAINYKQLANLKIRAGEVYDKVLDPDEAILRYEQVLSKKDTLLKDDPERAGELHYRLGIVYFKRKEYDKAESQLTKAIKYALQPYELSDAKFMLASIYLGRKEYETALILNGGALENWSPQKDALPNENFKGFLQFGKLSTKQNSSSQAKANYKRMMGKTEEWSLDNELVNASEEKITYLLNPSLSDNYNVSLLSYRQSSIVVPDLPKEQQTIAQIDIEIAEGNLFFETKNYTRAKRHFEKALELMKTIYPEKHPMVVEVARLLSEVYLEEQIFDQAIKFIDQALAASMDKGISMNKNGLPAIGQAKFPLELLYAIGTKGKVLKGMYQETKDQKNLIQALNLFEGTIQLLNQLRRTYRSEGSKYELAKLGHEFSHEALLVCYQLYQNTKDIKYLQQAFNYGEIAKSSLLLESIRDLKARKIAKIPDAIIQKENKLKVEIAYLKGEVYYETKQGKFKDENRLIELIKELNEVKNQHEEVVLLIEKKYKKYFDLKYNYATASVEEIQATLNENEQMLSYSMLDSFIIVFVVGKNEFECYQVYHNIEETRKQIVQFLRAIKEADIQNITHFGNLLFKILISPIKERKANKDLIIIPDGFLNNISFETLPTSTEKNVEYLLYQNSICYNYSATIYLASKERSNKKTNVGIIGFAPDFSKIDSILNLHENYSKTIAELKLTPLPYANKEAEDLKEMFASNSLIIQGAFATETAFKKVAHEYGVLHFATHGIINHRKPMFSSLAFIVDDQNDGMLHTHELYALELNAELVTLSACNSGVGKLYKGEGAMSIARGFAYSGAPNMITTLWPVSDGATYVIMSKFYANLKSGMRKHHALRKAKIEFIKEQAVKHKFVNLWGGILLVGNTNEVTCLINKEQGMGFLWPITIAASLIIVFLFFRQRSKSKSKLTN